MNIIEKSEFLHLLNHHKVIIIFGVESDFAKINFYLNQLINQTNCINYTDIYNVILFLFYSKEGININTITFLEKLMLTTYVDDFINCVDVTTKNSELLKCQPILQSFLQKFNILLENNTCGSTIFTKIINDCKNNVFVVDDIYIFFKLINYQLYLINTSK